MTFLGYTMCCSWIFWNVVFGDMDLERKLLNDVFDSIDTRVRPAANWSQPVDICVSFNPLFLKGLDEPMQIMEMYGWIAVRWHNPKIKWEPAEYGDIEYVTLPATDVWIPDIGIINSANHLYDDVFQPDKYRATAKHNGEIRVVFSGTIQTICMLDVTYFPFDEQVCHIELDSWTLPMSGAKFGEDSSIELDNLRENGIWRVTDTWRVFNHDLYKGVYFRTISFTFRLKRKPLFVLLNVAAPCLVLFLLELLVFCIPSEAGEKISLGITLMLSLTVFQLVIQGSMPATSDYLPLMSMYLVGVTAISAMTIVLTVIVLRIHHHDPSDPLPDWVQKYILGFLGKVLGLSKETKKANDRKISNENTTCKEFDEASETELSKTRFLSEADPMNEVSIGDWSQVARVMDRCFLVIVLLLAITFTAAIFGTCALNATSRDKPLTGYGYLTEKYRDVV